MGLECSPIYPAHKISNIYLPILPMLYTDLLCLVFPAPGTFCVLYTYILSMIIGTPFCESAVVVRPQATLALCYVPCSWAFAVVHIFPLKYIFTYNFYQLWWWWWGQTCSFSYFLLKEVPLYLCHYMYL